MASFNMFGKNNESIQSSERTKNLKNRTIFSNKNTLNPYKKNHQKYYNLINGYFNCKNLKKYHVDSSGCFWVWLDDDLDNINVKNCDDWKLSKIEYDISNTTLTNLDDVELVEINDLSGQFFPYKKDSIKNPKYVYKKYTFFDPNNSKNITIYSNNLKFKINNSLIN